MTTQNQTSTDLAENDCWDLLRATGIGRLAIVIAGRPEIFPLNFVVDHGTIVFRSAAGTKVSELSSQPPAAFEIDGQDDDCTAWSVVIHGHLEPLISFDAITADVIALYPLHAGPKPRFIRIVPESVTGRRFDTVAASTWQTSPELGRRQAWE